jgi:hypothetical protein
VTLPVVEFGQEPEEAEFGPDAPVKMAVGFNDPLVPVRVVVVFNVPLGQVKMAVAFNGRPDPVKTVAVSKSCPIADLTDPTDPTVDPTVDLTAGPVIVGPT